MNIKLITKYIAKIREYIKSKDYAPIPEEILKHLLDTYVSFNMFPALSFLTTFTCNHTEYARELSIKLGNEDENVDVLASINDYLATHAIDKNGDLFGLLVAYFYYYKDTYSNLSTYDDLIKKVVIPLHVFKDIMNRKSINFFLRGFNSTDYHHKLHAYTYIGSLHIPEGEKNREVISRLIDSNLRYKRNVNTKIEDFTTYLNRSAFRSLSNLNIPKYLQGKVWDEIFDGYFTDYRTIEAIASLPFPHSARRRVINFLMEYADGWSGEIRGHAWKSLDNIGIPFGTKINFIQQKLGEICMMINNGCSNMMREWDSLVSIGKAWRNVPKYIKIEFNNILARDCNLSVSELAKLMVFAQEILPDHDIFRAVDYEKLIALPAKKRYYTLNVLKDYIVNDRLDTLIETLISEIVDKPQACLHSILSLRDLPIPTHLVGDVRQALVSSIDRVEMPISYLASALSKVNIDEEMFDYLLDKFLEKSKRAKDPHREADYIYFTFSKLSKTSVSRDSFFRQLLLRINSSIICQCLSSMELNHPERHSLTVVILEKLKDKNLVYHDSLPHILELFYKLQKDNPIHEIITMRLRIECIIESASDAMKICLVAFIKRLEDLCETKMLLNRKLPAELVFQTMKFM